MKKYGIILVNLGTPDRPDKKSVKAYLREFLMDKHVIKLPFPLRFFLVYCIIVPKRLNNVTALYQEIWQQDSPIRMILLEQVKLLSEALKDRTQDDFVVEAAMTYGQPSIDSAVANLQRAGVDELLILPLYPQFSRTTTLPVKERVDAAISRHAFTGKQHFVDSYFGFPAYVAALQEQITERWQQHQIPEVLLLSYHGIPKSYTEAGDPYIAQCEQTTALLQQALADFPVRILASYQSRVTSEEWAKPYTDDILGELAQQGVRDIHVCCPGFSADCLETIDEIGVEYKTLFLDSGGERFFVFPALNCRESHIDMMLGLVVETLALQEFS